MSQNLKQNALGRKMLHRFCRCLMGLGMALALWNSSLFIPLAQADVFTYNFTPGTLDDAAHTPTRAFTPDEENAVKRGFAYVNSVVVNSEKGTNREIRFLIHTNTNISEPEHNGFKSTSTNGHANYDVDSRVCFNDFGQWVHSSKSWSLEKCTQFMNGYPSMESTSIHEMAHCLGMSLGRETPNNPVNDDDQIIKKTNLWTQQIIEKKPNGDVNENPFGNGLYTVRGTDNLNARLADGYRYYFNGNEATKVYGDYWVTNSTAHLTIENGQKNDYKYDDGSTLTHCYTRFGRLNAYSGEALRPFYNEAELAVLKDLDNTVNIRQQFGHSLYQENIAEVSVTNTQNYGANWNEATQTYDNTPNTALYGIGLHIVGDRYNVTQAANLLADGKNGTGIRVEGTGNTVTINPGVRVTGNGENGIGVLATHGTDNILNNRGTIEATGKEGTAVYLNYGSWTDPSYSPYKVKGGLLAFDNTGTINAGAENDAILVKNHNKALAINIMGGSIIGNITSKSPDAAAKLTFGKQADADGRSTETGNADFNMTYAGDIVGKNGFQLEQWGGNLTLTGSKILVNELRVADDINAAKSTLNAPGDITVFSDVILSNKNSTKIAIYDGKSTGSLDAESITVNKNATIQNVVNIYAEERVENMGNIVNVSTIDSDEVFENSGNINNVTTVNVGNKFTNNSSGSMTNVSAVNSNSFQNRGDLTVGEAGAIGTMDVEGFMYTNGTLNIDANLQAKPPVSGTTADLITVSENGTAGANDGKMLINGGQININELHSTGSSYYRADINHNIIETENGVDVAIELKAKESGFDIPLFKPVIGHDDKNVWVGLQRDFLYGPAAQTGNQDALGYYIDEIGKTPNPEGDLFPVLIQLDSLNGDKEAGIVSPRALHALEEMSGAVYGTLTSLANQHATMVNNSLAKRLRCWSPCEVIGNNWNLWGEGYGIGGNAVSDGNANGYNYTVGGMLIGIDRQINFNGRFGFYFAVGDTNANVKGLSESADSTDIFFGLYFNYKGNYGWYTTMFAGFGNSDYDVERNFSFIPRSNKSSFNSTQFSAYLERGKNFSLSNIWVLQPYGGLQFIGSDRGAVQEHGADLLDLTVAGASMSSLRSLLGIKLSTVNCVTGQKLNYEFSAAWMHEFLDTTSAVSAQMSNPGGTYFESSPTFTVLGNNDGRDWVVAGLGLNYAFTDYFKLFGGYDCMVNGVGSMHRGNFGLEIKR